MREPTSLDRERVAETFDTLRGCLRAERRRTVAERRAFETFANRIDDVAFAGATPDGPLDGRAENGHGATVVSSSHTGVEAPTEAIRRAYEQTVMAVSFYDEEYGDDYAESLRAEFGPPVATALTDPGCFGPAAKPALMAAIQRAIGERAHLVETCERERESVDVAADTLQSVAASLDDLVRSDPENASFGALEARWKRLSRLQERCETAATNRQAAIEAHRSRHDLPIEAPDICSYLYASHDSAYPVLAVCAGLARLATALQTTYERAMARY